MKHTATLRHTITMQNNSMQGYEYILQQASRNDYIMVVSTSHLHTHTHTHKQLLQQKCVQIQIMSRSGSITAGEQDLLPFQHKHGSVPHRLFSLPQYLGLLFGQLLFLEREINLHMKINARVYCTLVKKKKKQAIFYLVCLHMYLQLKVKDVNVPMFPAN